MSWIHLKSLKEKLTEHAKKGEMFFRMDVRPPYEDTPDNWEDVLEAVFTSSK